jgi:hypothetical protein
MQLLGQRKPASGEIPPGMTEAVSEQTEAGMRMKVYFVQIIPTSFFLTLSIYSSLIIAETVDVHSTTTGLLLSGPELF